MRRNLKKVMSAVLVAAMTFGTPIAVNQNVTVAEAAAAGVVASNTDYGEGKIVDGSAGWNSAGAPDMEVKNYKKHMKTTLVFENDPFKRDENNWSNFVIETPATADAKGITLRADAYGWTYGDAANTPTYTVTKSWNDDWDVFKKNCPGKVVLDAEEKDNNTLVFTITFTSGDTEVYTVTYPDGVPSELSFHVGADGGIITQKTITFSYDAAYKFSFTTSLDGVKDTNTYTVSELEDAGLLKNGKIILPDVGTGNYGWFTDPNSFDQKDLVTELDAEEYLTENGIIVYGYKPHAVAPDKEETVDGGTFDWTSLKDKYSFNETVQLKTKADAGKTPAATIKDAKGNSISYEVTDLEDGVQAIEFKMPASDVTISDYRFEGISTTKLSDAIVDAKSVYETNNETDLEKVDTLYSADSWKVFKNAYESALKVLDKAAEKTQAQINNTAKELNEAKDALVYACAIEPGQNTLVKKGDSYTLKYKVYSKAATNKVTFTSSDEKVATVNENGLVTGVAAGTAKITLKTADGTSASVKVKVLDDTEMILGATSDYNFAPVTDTAAWTSSDEKVATVKAGKVTAVATGSAVIGVTTADNDSYDFKVNVIDTLDCSTSSPMSPGVEITDEGVYMTFKNTQNKDASDNWLNPRMFIYSGSTPDLTKDPAIRADLWVDNVNTGATNRGNGVNWANWLEACKKGVDCSASIVKTDEGIRVRLNIGDVWGEYTVPTEAGKTYYAALTGASCKIENLKVIPKSDYSEPSIGTVISTPKPAATPGPDIDVPISADEVNADETLVGTEWWTGMQTGKDYVLSGTDVSTELYIAADKLVNGYGAFNVEVYTANRKFFTTGSDKNAWIAEQATGTVSPFTPGASELIEGHVYKITVTRKDKDVTVKYYDATAQKDYFEISLTGSNFDDEIMVHVLGQVGTFKIGQSVTVDPNKTPAPTTSEEPTTAPSTEPTNSPDVTTAPSADPSATATATPAPTTSASTVKKGDKATVGNAKYVATSSKEVSYTAAKKATASVVIPATVKVKGKTLKVTSIAAKAFKGNKIVKTLTVGKNITTIGNNAFSNCKNLKTLTIKSTNLKASKIAKNAFKGISKKTTIKVPKKKLKAYKKLLRKKGLAKSVKCKAI